MTNKLHNHLKPETESIRLSDAEKNAMRMRLQAAMGDVPDVPAVPVKVKSPYSWIFSARPLAFSALALLLVVSTSTAYAAEGSLPGGLLYPVKINVIEPVRVALATSPAAKAQVHADIAVERVKEAETLAVRGDLTKETADEISDNYDTHAQRALALADDAGGATTTVTALLMATTTPPAGDIAAEATTTHSRVRKASFAPHTTVVAVLSAPSHASSTETLRDKLDASLQVQTKILDGLRRDARARHSNIQTDGEDTHD